MLRGANAGGKGKDREAKGRHAEMPHSKRRWLHVTRSRRRRHSEKETYLHVILSRAEQLDKTLQIMRHKPPPLFRVAFGEADGLTDDPAVPGRVLLAAGSWARC